MNTSNDEILVGDNSWILAFGRTATGNAAYTRELKPSGWGVAPDFGATPDTMIAGFGMPTDLREEFTLLLAGFSDGRLVNVFLKCEVSQDGQVRGRRNDMLDDSDVHWHRQIKAAVGGVTAAVTGDPAVFVSVSAAHQGPDGGGPVAAIVDPG